MVQDVSEIPYRGVKWSKEDKVRGMIANDKYVKEYIGESKSTRSEQIESINLGHLVSQRFAKENAPE